MQYLGEIISLVVAVMWTATALFADQASHRIGSMSTNFFRMVLSAILLAGLLWIVIGHPYPAFADGKTWLWMGLSALVGYVFGDFCLFNSYIVIGARFGQLFMTLAPPFAAIAGWALLGETLSWKSWFAMVVTLTGIAISILNRGRDGHSLTLKLPVKGVLLGIGAGLGQGVGLVLSKIGMQHYAAALPADAPEALRIRRILQRNPNLTEADIRQRMSRQIPQEEKCRRADLVVCTGETYAEGRKMRNAEL